MDKNYFRRVLSTRREAQDDSDCSECARKFERSASEEECSCTTCHPTKKESSTSTRDLERKKSLLSSEGSEAGSRIATYKEQLEAKIMNEEMTEKMSFENHLNLKKNIQNCVDLMQGLSIYLQSLDIRVKTTGRLERLLADISPRRKTSSEDFDQKAKSIINKCKRNSELPRSFQDSCREFDEKHKIQTQATSKFYYILQNEKLSHSEMRRLELEYDGLRKEFNRTVTSVSSKLNEIFEKLSEIVEKCVHDVLSIMECLMDQDKNIHDMLSDFTSENRCKTRLLAKCSEEQIKQKKSCTRCHHSKKSLLNGKLSYKMF